ncbi:MAG: 4'-phosphopantetheinyl transferase superfamily protein [Lysobacterales bacterium]
MKRDSNRIHLYFSWSDQITDAALLCRYQSLLTDSETEQMSRLYFTGHRHQYLLTRALVRSCLSQYYPVKPGEWQFSKNSYGKPQVSHPELKLTTSFNLSHAKGLIVCAIAPGFDIGVDVEDTQRNTRAAFDSLASYFSEQEIRDLAALPKNKQKQRFFDYWTLKEAYIKARGMGLALPLSKFSFHFIADDLSEFRVQKELGDDARNWQFWRISMSGHYRIAIALNSPQQGFEVSAFNTVPLIGHDNVQPNFL